MIPDALRVLRSSVYNTRESSGDAVLALDALTDYLDVTESRLLLLTLAIERLRVLAPEAVEQVIEELGVEEL